MDPAEPDGGSRGGESRPRSQRPHRNFDRGACHWGSSRCFAQDRKASQVCRYFQRGFCFHGDGCSYRHLQPPLHLEWGRRHSEPHITLSGPLQGLTRRGSEPSYLPSVTVGWGWARAYQGMEPGLEELFSKAEDIGGSSWKSLSLSCESSGSTAAADGDHSYFPKSRPMSDPVQELLAPLQSLDLERVQDSRDIVCGVCMDKVWDKPEAERIFGILPNCSHPHCLGCLRTWRKSRGDFPLGVIKACPQCRVPSSYIIPCKFWVSKGPKKEQLIRNFKARTSQIRCRFFMRRNGRCPFKSDCIYLHQLPDKAPTSDPPWPRSMQLASVVGKTAFLGGTEPEEEVFFMDCALTMAFWGSEPLLDPNSSYHCLL
ncbi:probable E3 ubiquitin-protein ligase makorin-1 isoform X2 [Physeter macrocephalus]|uniref:RING-type E3 ubiquitin transferase n=1 Tax=Physeter macrocephalus TaxID=9755 RepID=A0A455AU47_PHYMC|nr:probable E3 ubiquitin-protein ligase makorin-1 isoform X2 [Physeter catodon]|eukprot:XP_028340087.1 probable E3 ubiquitin-protein ligase makorin-1 isoform X2 [Physeter catodon]